MSLLVGAFLARLRAGLGVAPAEDVGDEQETTTSLVPYSVEDSDNEACNDVDRSDVAADVSATMDQLLSSAETILEQVPLPQTVHVLSSFSTSAFSSRPISRSCSDSALVGLPRLRRAISSPAELGVVESSLDTPTPVTAHISSNDDEQLVLAAESPEESLMAAAFSPTTTERSASLLALFAENSLAVDKSEFFGTDDVDMEADNGTSSAIEVLVDSEDDSALTAPNSPFHFSPLRDLAQAERDSSAALLSLSTSTCDKKGPQKASTLPEVLQASVSTGDDLRASDCHVRLVRLPAEVTEHHRADSALCADMDEFLDTTPSVAVSSLPLSQENAVSEPSRSNSRATSVVSADKSTSSKQKREHIQTRASTGRFRSADASVAAGSARKRPKQQSPSPERESAASNRPSRSSKCGPAALLSPLRKKKRALESHDSSDDSSSESDEESDLSEEASEPSRPKRRPKGDKETRAREFILFNPDHIFAEAESVVTGDENEQPKKKGKQAADTSQARPKGVPTVVVPPESTSDRQRALKSRRAIRKLVERFVLDSSVSIDFKKFKHLERLQIVRRLLPIAYADDHDVSPLLRLLRQNGRTSDDPLVLVASSLSPELIDTRLCTQASSAQLTLFNYLVPLFMQRWGLMMAGTAAPPQWRSIGQKHSNWNDFGRWPELLLVAPDAVVSFAREIFDAGENTPPSKFQTELSQKFVGDVDALNQWCLARRCSKVVNNDKTGKSLYMDLIVSPMAIWLRILDPTAVARALTHADEIALSSDMDARMQYPSEAVYREAVITLTELLAGAHSSIAFYRLVRQTLANNAAANEMLAEEWVRYSGEDPVVCAGARRLQDRPPDQITTALSLTDGVPALGLTCRWDETTGNMADVFRLNVPLPDWSQLRDSLLEMPWEPVAVSAPAADCLPAEDDAPMASTSGLPHTRSAMAMPSPDIFADIESSQQQIFAAKPPHSPGSIQLCISGLSGRLPESPFREIFSAGGKLRALSFLETTGEIIATFEDEDAAHSALMAIYGTSTRPGWIRAILRVEAGEDSTISTSSTAAKGQAAASSVDTEREFFFGGDSSGIRLATTLLLARLPCDSYHSTQDAAQKTVVTLANRESESTSTRATACGAAVDAERRFAVLAEAPYDFYGARFEFGPLLVTPGKCSPDVYVFFLREVVLQHLQQYPTDLVYVTPPSWFDVDASLQAAAAPAPLFDVMGNEINVSRCRLLLISTFLVTEPILITIAFPQALDSLRPSLTPSFIVLFGYSLTTSLVRKLLVAISFRLEALLQTQSAIIRANVAVVKLDTAAELAPNAQLFASFLQLGHAARTMLQLTASVDCLSLRRAFFTDQALLTTFVAQLKNLIRLVSRSKPRLMVFLVDEHGNPQLTNVGSESNQQGVLNWRALATIADREPPMVWDDAAATAAYTIYAVQRYFRALKQPQWSSRKSTKASTEEVKGAYELISFELRQYGAPVTRALSARLHQLCERGFRCIGGTDATIELCRRGTEHVTLSLTDFSLRREGRVYSFTEEMTKTNVGWGTAPVWN